MFHQFLSKLPRQVIFINTEKACSFQQVDNMCFTIRKPHQVLFLSLATRKNDPQTEYLRFFSVRGYWIQFLFCHLLFLLSSGYELYFILQKVSTFLCIHVYTRLQKKKLEVLGFSSLFSYRKMTHLEKRGTFINVTFYWKSSLYTSITEGLFQKKIQLSNICYLPYF